MATEANILVENLPSPAQGKTLKVAHIAGQLDESNVDEKIKEIYKAVESAPKDLYLIFDLENLEYMNSKSIGYFTDLYGKISEGGGKVAIAKAKPNIIDILQVVGLTQLIEAFDSVDAAKEKILSESTVAPVAPAPAPAPVAPQPEPTPVVVPAPVVPQPEPTPTVAPAPEPVAPAPVPEAPLTITPAAQPAQPAEPATPAQPSPAESQPAAPAAPQAGEESTYKFEK